MADTQRQNIPDVRTFRNYVRQQIGNQASDIRRLGGDVTNKKYLKRLAERVIGFLRSQKRVTLLREELNVKSKSVMGYIISRTTH